VKTVINFAENDLILVAAVEPPENLGEYTGKEGNPPTAPKGSKVVPRPVQPFLKTSPSTTPISSTKAPTKTVVTTSKADLKPKPSTPKPNDPKLIAKPSTAKAASKVLVNTTSSQAKLNTLPKK